MGFRGKQIVTLTLVAAVVAGVTSLANLAVLARVSVTETRSSAELLAETLYHQASRVIRQHPRDQIENALTSDPSLENYAQGVVGYSSTVMYVAITNEKDVALVHSDPSRKGQPVTATPSLASLAEENPLSQLWHLSRGHRVLEVAIPFDVDGARFGAVRVAISTLLLTEAISGALARNVLLATSAVLVAFVASFYLANRLLAPIEKLRRELGRFDPGEGKPPLDLRDEDDVGRIAEFFSTMSQRLAERSSRDTESSWLPAMLGGLTDAVLVVSAEGRVLSLNPPAEKLLGRPRDEIQGRLLEEILPADHPVMDIAAKAMHASEPVGPFNAKIENGGRPVIYSLQAQVLRDASGISGVMVSARDIERLARLGSQLSYSQKLAALGRLTSGIAHEIKNPLNAMVIHVALLREKFARASPETQASLDTLEQEIRRLDRVIQGFLRFTRPEDLRLTSVEMDELVGEVVRLVSAEAQAGKIEIVTDVPDGLPSVYGDRELLQQALLNLVRNACEAMPRGGKLCLVVRPAEDGVEIRVSDNGVGIEPELLDRIFDLYVTTKSKGSGIGLSMVYRIVQLHGGEITVESTKGKGSQFTVRLPELST
ncbi:MAG TPA: ATP-binding protein [Vicinamibacteria bacterium]|nr:ATP-binding protein [Vicinamibacteria bacterium]